MDFPKNLKYTKDHEWALVEGIVVTVGVTDHAQNALGDIVYIDLPETGKILKSGDPFGVVESIKAVSDLYSPATGKVIDKNTRLADDPSLVNKDPYKQAWMIKIELTDKSSLETLMDCEAYSKYVASLK
ncbi:MAG: glycine cleavage system protein GcvH [Candidatus Poribacteria bacterium]